MIGTNGRGGSACSLLLMVVAVCGCAGLPPGADCPKTPSSALAHPEETVVGRRFAEAAREHGGNSAFRIITAGVDGFLARVQMINAAERTLDLQYYIFRVDETGRLLTETLLRAADRGVRVRVLTSSLESSTEAGAESGDQRFRVPLLEDGVELYEIRSLLGTTRGSGQTVTVSRCDNYSLHANLFVLDRRQLFIGSMNFDQRSKRLNTEIGLIIDSPELAQQTAARFDAMAQPVNCYSLALVPGSAGARPHLVWKTVDGGQPVEYTREPARSEWQRLQVRLLSFLRMDAEL